MANQSIMQGLLESLMKTPAQVNQEKGVVLANLMSQPNPAAAMAAYALPQQMANVETAARGLFGLKAPQTTADLINSNPTLMQSSAGMLQLAKLAQAAGRTAEAAQLIAAAAEQKKVEEDNAVAAQERALREKQINSQIASADAQVKALLANARTPEEVQAAIAASNALTEQRKIETQNAPAELQLRQKEAENRQAAIAAQLDQNKLQREGLDVATRRTMNDAEQSALSEFNRAENLKRVADAWSTARPTPGFWGGFEGSVKDFFGNQGGEEQLRTEYTQVLQSGVLSSLPPGAASDRDIIEAKKGWPNEYSNPDMVASFLRGMAKLSAIASEQAAQKAKWIGDTKNLTGFTEAWRKQTQSPTFAEDIAKKYNITWDLPIDLTDEQAKGLLPPPAPKSGFTGRGAR